MIVLFAGQPGSGKTTLANSLVKNFQCSNNKLINVDGDDFEFIMKK